jgi:hypothetical protein
MAYIGSGISRFNTADELTVTGDAVIDTTTLVVDSTNNRVGIGTSSPYRTLVVSGDQTTEGLLEIAASTPQLLFSVPSGGLDSRIHNDGSGNFIFGTGTNSATPTERMRINSSGNVGIGTTSPSEQLSLYKSGASNAIQVQSHNSTPGSYNEASLKFALSSSASSTLNWDINAEQTGLTVDYEGSEKFRITSAGLVGIGTSSPSGGVQLDVRGTGVLQLVNTDTVQLLASNGGSTLKNVSNNPLIFGTNNTERMRIDSSGSVGIGTSSPIAQSKLTVAGGAGSISVTGSDGNFAAGGQRSFIDFTSGKARIGSTGGGAAGTTLGLYVGTGLEAVSVDASGKVGIGRSPSHVLDILCGNTTALQAIRIADTSPTEYFGVFNANEGGQTPNAANATLKVRGMNATSRAINAGGTVNASGADYAEYMTKADGCGTIAKGAVCGVDADGKLTDVFANAHSFVIKSTDPSYVGGDVWSIASTDADGNQTTLEGDALEAARQTVDRIAFSGQVPCTITGITKVGDFVIAQAKSDGGIEAVAVTSPTFEQYSVAIGKVWKLGSSQHTVAVKIG